MTLLYDHLQHVYEQKKFLTIVFVCERAREREHLDSQSYNSSYLNTTIKSIGLILILIVNFTLNWTLTFNLI